MPESVCKVEDPTTGLSSDCLANRNIVKSKKVFNHFPAMDLKVKRMCTPTKQVSQKGIFLKQTKSPAGHGPQTGRCIPNDKPASHDTTYVCEIQSWCPVEDDRLLLGKEKPLITGSQHHTVLIKNSVKFSYFGERFHRNNMPDRFCIYNFTDPDTRLCNIFKLGRK